MKLKNLLTAAVVLCGAQTYAGNDSGGGGGGTPREPISADAMRTIITRTYEGAPLIYNYLSRLELGNNKGFEAIKNQLEVTINSNAGRARAFWSNKGLRFATKDNLCLDGSMASFTDKTYCYDIELLSQVGYSAEEAEIKLMALHFHETAHAAGIGSSKSEEEELLKLQKLIEKQATESKYDLDHVVNVSDRSVMLEITLKTMDPLLSDKNLSRAAFCHKLSRVIENVSQYPIYERQESRGASYITQIEESYIDIQVWKSVFMLASNCPGAEDEINGIDNFKEIVKRSKISKKTSMAVALKDLLGIDLCSADYDTFVCRYAELMNVKLGKDRKFKSEAQSHIGDIKKFLMQSYAADRYKYGKQ